MKDCQSKRLGWGVMALLLLLIVTTSASSTASNSATTTSTKKERLMLPQFDQQMADATSRTLQNFAECDQVIGTITSEEVRNAGRSFLSNYISDSDVLDRSVDIIFLPVKYDLTVIKLCASCENHANLYYERGIFFPGYHATYCNVSDQITYTTPLSMLAFLPQYETNNTALPSKVKLRTFLTMPPTNINDDGTVVAPSFDFQSRWFGSPNSIFTDRDFFSTYLPGMVAASAGSISLFPDYPGALASSSNGESILLKPSLFRQRSYEQATAVSYLELQRYVMETSGGCTILDDAITIYGNDADAAFAVPIATIVLQRFGIKCLTAFVSTGPFDLSLFLQDAITGSGASISSSLTTRNKWIELAAYTMAFNNEHSSIGAEWLSPTYTTALIQKYEAVPIDITNATGSAVIAVELPNDPIDLFHPNVVEALRIYNSTDWDVNQRDIACNVMESTTAPESVKLAETSDNITIQTNFICQLRQQYSAFKILLSRTDRPWITNVSACYSNEDEMVNGTRQYEYPGFQQDVELIAKYWKRYTQPIGLDALAITSENHTVAVQLCTVAPLLFFTLDGHRPTRMEDWGNYAPAMTTEELLQCNASPSSTNSPAVTPNQLEAVSPESTVVTSPNQSPVTVSMPSSASQNGDISPPVKPTTDIVIPNGPSFTSEKDDSNSNEKERTSTSHGSKVFSILVSRISFFIAFILFVTIIEFDCTCVSMVMQI
jgi:hypothetical protein